MTTFAFIHTTIVVDHLLPSWLVLLIVVVAFAATVRPSARQRIAIAAVLVAIGYSGLVFAGDIICAGCDRCYGLDPSSFWFWYYGCFLP